MEDDKPLLIDLFCGVGGAGMGYHRAGFDVIGVDKLPQPEYPFQMFRSDAIEFIDSYLVDSPGWPRVAGRPIAAIHASPPCKRFSTLSKSLGYESHTDLLTPAREALYRLDDKLGRGQIPWIIENVPGAPMRSPIVLCGSMFGLQIEAVDESGKPWDGNDSFKGAYLQRHRLFESNILLMVPGPCNHNNVRNAKGEQIRAMGVYGNGRGGGELKFRTANAAQAKALMGIDWAGRIGVTQAVPPAYTEYLGTQLLEVAKWSQSEQQQLSLPEL